MFIDKRLSLGGSDRKHKHGNRLMGPPAPAAPPFKQFSTCAARLALNQAGCGPFEARRTKHAVGCTDFQNANRKYCPQTGWVRPNGGMEGSGRGELKVPAESAVRHTQVTRFFDVHDNRGLLTLGGI